MSDERKDITEVAEKIKAPKWYRRDSMFRAEIDLGEIIEGASATLKSARGREAKRINEIAKAGGEDSFSWSCRAATYAAHLESIEGCGDLMEAAPPEHRNAVKKWEDWLDGVDENLIGRLSEAITLFRLDVHSDDADTGETGNESKPLSEG